MRASGRRYPGRVSTTAREPRAVLDALRGSSRFLIQQVFKPIGNEYRISVPAPGQAEEGEPILFVKQKRLSIREDIRFRAAPDVEEHVFMIKAKTMFEFRGRHDVLDEGGQPIGLIEKDFTRSLLRSHWHVRNTTGAELFEGYEANWLIAIVRRVAGFLPEFLAVFTWLPSTSSSCETGRRSVVQARARQAPRPLRARARREPLGR